MESNAGHRFLSLGPEHTHAMGTALGQLLERGRTILLIGELGSGKTCFVQGVARGLEVPETYDITSPTYTLVNEYPGRIDLLHIDLYRLVSIDDAEAIGLGELLESPAAAAVEWADRLPKDYWPADSLTITFSHFEGDQRSLHLFGHGLAGDNLIDKLTSNWSRIAQALK